MRFRVLSWLTLVVISLALGDVTHAQPDPRVRITSPGNNFVVSGEPVTIYGTVDLDPSEFLFWKVEIQGRGTRTIGPIPEERQIARDWLTVDTVRTDPVVNGPLVTLPAWPSLSEGAWNVRLVAIAYDGTFLTQPDQLRFEVRPNAPNLIDIRITRPNPVEWYFGTNNEVRGTMVLSRDVGSYQIELLGGPYSGWTVVDGPYINDAANPVSIRNGVIGHIPPAVELPFGRYQLRIVLFEPNGLPYFQPYLTDFAIQTRRISNLPVIAITQPRVRNNRINITNSVPLVGTVSLPDDTSYFKVEFRNVIPVNRRGIPREEAADLPYQDWTTIGEPRFESVTDDVLAQLPGIDILNSGNYVLRVVIVLEDGTFANEVVVRMNLQDPNAE